jgi:hypothetical protein
LGCGSDAPVLPSPRMTQRGIRLKWGLGSQSPLGRRFGCGGLQRSERTQVAVPVGIGGNSLKNQQPSPFTSGCWMPCQHAQRSSQRPSVAPGGPTGIPVPG